MNATIQQVEVDFSKSYAFCAGCGTLHLEDEMASGEDAKGQSMYLCDSCPVDAEHSKRIIEAGERPAVKVTVETL